jgi:F-type H+-transporting ATPase subunit a
MNLSHLTPDQVAVLTVGGWTINATLVVTWVVMLFLVLGSWLATRRLTDEVEISSRQNFIEVLVLGIRDQIRDTGSKEPELLLPFVGTLFLFIAASNLAGTLPLVPPPTGSLSTTTALALCVFLAVPLFGIAKKGVLGYLRNYTQPSVLMLPFNLIGELSRTLALAVRLGGNMMSGVKIGAVMLAVAPLLVPVVMNVFGLLTGFIQAYIFAALAVVYIVSAMEVERTPNQEEGSS